MKTIQKLLTSSQGLGLLLVAVVAINIIATKLYFRADMTEDDIYSLSEGSENIINKLDQDITIQFYFTRSLKEVPVVIKTYASRVEEVLREYSSRSGGKITVEVYDPKPDSDEEVWARRYGVQGMRMPAGAEMYFGAAFLFGDKDVAIPYFDPRREEFLEYDISEAILQAQTDNKMKVGIVSSLGVMGAGAGMPFGHPAGGGEAWAFIQQLQKNASVTEVKLSEGVVPDDINVLVLLHAKGIDPKASYALDQFVMRGGRLIVAVDPLSRVDLQKMGMMRQQGQMPDASSDLPALFDAWGVKFNKSQIVGDLRYTVRVNVGGAVVPYPFWMALDNSVLSKESQITSKLNSLLIAEAGSVSVDPAKGYKFEKLITTSKQSGTASAQIASFMGPADFARELKEDDQEHVIAGLLVGKFKSAFPQGAPNMGENASKNLPKHIAASSDEGVVLIITDTDFINDGNAVEKIRFGQQVILRPRNDNLAFMANAIEFLGGSVDLISIRSRGRIARPFTKVQEIQVAAQQRYKQEEERLSQQISEVQKKLNELQKQRSSGSRFSLSSEQMAEVEKFRKQEKNARERRREVRKNLREEIESLGRWLIAANMLIMPTGVGIFGFGIFVQRTRRRKKRRGQ